MSEQTHTHSDINLYADFMIRDGNFEGFFETLLAYKMYMYYIEMHNLHKSFYAEVFKNMGGDSEAFKQAIAKYHRVRKETNGMADIYHNRHKTHVTKSDVELCMDAYAGKRL